MWKEHKRLLVIDDNSDRRQHVKTVLEFLGEQCHITDCAQWRQSVAEAGIKDVGAVLLGDGLSNKLLDDLKQWQTAVPLLLLNTSEEELSTEMQEWQARTLGVLPYPFSMHQAIDALHRCQQYAQQYAKQCSRGERHDTRLFKSLVGTSAAIQTVRELILQVADKDVSVMIQGESGTGKEVVARNLHQHSHRHDKPFVPVNCGAIPAELLESELFGHEKGAFTGAINSRAGRFEMAEGGTLFLDEIGDMPLNMQVKILRVLQEHTFERVGSNKTFKANVRIIAATHKNLEQMIAEGTFREDLYYRLNVFPIDMPSLRDRAEDIPLLINELVARLESAKRGSVRFNSAAVMSLCRHDWPGNVRELANLVERLAILYPNGVVGLSELPTKFLHVDGDWYDEPLPPVLDVVQSEGRLVGVDVPALLPVNGLDLREYLQDLECSLIQQALDDSHGVVARAADKLNIRRTTLVEKMRKYNLGRKDKELAE